MLVRRTVIVMIVFAGLVAAMIFGFGRMPGGFVPSEDEGYFFVNVQLPNAASLDRTEEVMDLAFEQLQKTSRCPERDHHRWLLAARFGPGSQLRCRDRLAGALG